MVHVQQTILQGSPYDLTQMFTRNVNTGKNCPFVVWFWRRFSMLFYLRPTTLNPTSTTFCQDLQANIFNIIQGYTTTNRASFYAPFANTDRSEWSPIANTNPSSNVVNDNSLGGVCKSLIVGATIQIAYSLVGNVENPQAKLVFVSYDWNDLADVNLRVSSYFWLIKMFP